MPMCNVQTSVLGLQHIWKLPGSLFGYVCQIYRTADKSLARPGRKQANVSVRMAWISFGALPCREKKLDDSPRLDVEIERPWHASWSG